MYVCTCRSRAANPHPPTAPTNLSLSIIFIYPQLSLLIQPLPVPIDGLMLLQKQKRGNRMGPQPHKTRHPPPKYPADAFIPDRPGQQRQHAPLRPRRPLDAAHDARLDHIDGTAHRRGHEPGQQGRREVGRRVVPHRCPGQQGALEGVVAGELAGRHEDGAQAVRPDAAPEAAPAFLARHADEAVDGVAVVAALGGWQGGVVLHAHVEDVGWVAGDAAEEAGGAGHGDEGGEGGGGAGGREGFLQL